VGNTRPICRIGVGTRKTLSMRRATSTSQNVQRQWDSLNSTMILSTALVTECLVCRGLRIDWRAARGLISSVLSECPRGGAEKINLTEYSAYLSRIVRADERTRTADLLITSDPSGVAEGCRVLQIPQIWAAFSALSCWILPRIAFPVVSEWCQFLSGTGVIRSSMLVLLRTSWTLNQIVRPTFSCSLHAAWPLSSRVEPNPALIP
jgi:hypothetical protein